MLELSFFKHKTKWSSTEWFGRRATYCIKKDSDTLSKEVNMSLYISEQRVEVATDILTRMKEQSWARYESHRKNIIK